MLKIHVSEGTAEGWFGRGKTSAIASITIITVLLISVIAAGVFAAANVWGETSVSQPTTPVTPATPTEPAPAPAPETPVPPESPTSDKEEVDETVDPETGAISISAFIRNTINDKYDFGDIVVVSGIVKEVKWIIESTYSGYGIEFEPDYKGFTVTWRFQFRSDDDEEVRSLWSGQKVIVAGDFCRSSYTKNQILVLHCKLIKVY